MAADVFDREKPIVFTYEEILTSTDSFSDANLLGHGTYGSVYYGVLRDQVQHRSCPLVCIIFLVIAFSIVNMLSTGGCDKENDGH